MAASQKEYGYHRPGSLAAALDLKASLGPEARFVAGGTDVMVLKRHGVLAFNDLISLRRVPELKGIEERDGAIRIGAGVTLSELMAGEIVRRQLPALWEAATVMGCTQMRNLATIGGNVMSAVASGDTLPPLLAMEAVAVLASPQGKRRVPLAQFFAGPRRTAIAEGELLLALEVPQPKPGAGCAFSKLGRRAALDLAVVSIAVCLEPGKGGFIARAKAAAGAVGPTPLLLPSAEEVLAGQDPSDELFRRAGEAALGDCSPWEDVRASKWYREEMIKVLFPRVAWAAWQRSGEGS